MHTNKNTYSLTVNSTHHWKNRGKKKKGSCSKKIKKKKIYKTYIIIINQTKLTNIYNETNSCFQFQHEFFDIWNL